MIDLEQAIGKYGSFHEDLIIAIVKGSSDLTLTIQRRSGADKLEDQVPIRNATLVCHDVQEFAFNEKRKPLECPDFDSETNIDIEIIDLVTTFDPKIRIEVFWDGKIGETCYQDAKFDILADRVDFDFSDVEEASSGS